MAWIIKFYKTAMGNNPVQDYLNSLPREAKEDIAAVVTLLKERGTNLLLPHAKPVDKKLWELRVHSKEQIHRILYFAYKNKTMVFLHGVTKKTQKLSNKDIKLAYKRMNDYFIRGCFNAEA